MTTIDDFGNWLKINKPKSFRHYISGYSTINKIISNQGYEELDKNMSLEDYDVLRDKLFSTPEFEEKNRIGNNMYSSTLSSFREFLESESHSNIPEIIKPFDLFGWRWASPGIMSYLNDPQYLKPVLLAIEINGNGIANNNNLFKNIVQKVGENIYGLSQSEAKKISKIENEDPVKNIIENSANYWYHIGLLESTGQNARISDLGIKYLREYITNEEFVSNTIEHYSLPSNVYPEVERVQFEANNISIRPLKIITDILISLQAVEGNNYLVKEDLQNIIVPLSIDYGEEDIDVFVYHIINNRTNPEQYTSFPDCTSQYSENKGLRMLNEYLVFLEYFGVLKADEVTVGAAGRKYYLESNYFQEHQDLIKHEAKGINRIYYGPPGTGKSHSIKVLLKDKGIDKDHYTRITFHPDYDYSSFVGSYKPNMYNKPSTASEPTTYEVESISKYKSNSSYIQYSFVPQVFINMYLKASGNPQEDYYLVIEEINRGNCAEIFGDIFQLLDRNPEYDIEPSQEVLSYIEENYPSALIYGKMRMPNNLYIIASMNTSDQSLFPMDSAFKRRWEWEYVKIDYKCVKSDFVINLKENIFFSWLEFLKKINDIIFETTRSEDKQIGNWFLKGEIPNDFKDIHRQGIISRNDFLNKVVFYLWNDVFKDEMNDVFKNKEGRDVNLSHYFQTDEDIEDQKEDMLETFFKINLKLEPLDEGIDSLSAN